MKPREEDTVKITLTHSEKSAGLFGTKKVHFVEAHIELNADEEDVVRAQKLGPYQFITGGVSEIEYQVKDFVRRDGMTIRFNDFYAAQLFEQEFKERLHDLKRLIGAGMRPTNSSNTFEL
jgi:hypothetical protein